jgi:hypothetical protein
MSLIIQNRGVSKPFENGKKNWEIFKNSRNNKVLYNMILVEFYNFFINIVPWNVLRGGY